MTLPATFTRLLLAVLAAELLCADALRWPLTNATIQNPIEYQLGQEVIVAENWHREGALARHFLPSHSLDQRLPEWAYRDDFWRDYLSQPPLSYMLLYWSTQVFRHADPVVVGRLLAQALIAASVLVSAALLVPVFGFGATLAGLSFLIWGEPFLVFFIDGYYATTPAMLAQLLLVSWSVVFYMRELAGPGPAPRLRRRDLLAVAAIACIGTFSEWVALFGNAVAIAAFAVVGIAFHRFDARRARKAYAVAGAIAVGSATAEAATVLLFGTKVGFAFYWHGFMGRVAERSGGGRLWPYTLMLIARMRTNWPLPMLAVLAILAVSVVAFAIHALVRRGMQSPAPNGAVLLLALAIGFGGGVIYCYRLKNLVDLHWWFAGTWAIGWTMTVCCAVSVLRPLLRRGYATACAVVTVGAVAWNLSFVDLSVPRESPRHEIYRMIGRTLPRDGYPLVVADMPQMFEDYPFVTAYLLRPVVRYNADGDRYNLSGDLLLKLETTEDATPDLLENANGRTEITYLAYNPDHRQCGFDDVPMPRAFAGVPLNICRVRTKTLLQNPTSVWSTSVTPTRVDVAPAGGTVSIVVTAPRTWPWHASADGAFVTLASAPTAIGSGAARFVVAGNTGVTRRTSVTVAGQSVWITQIGAAGDAACVSGLDTQETWRAIGGTTPLVVHAPAGCSWRAIATAPWITLRLGPTSGTGDGEVRYTIAPNVGPANRKGAIIAGRRRFEMTQWGCQYELSSVKVHVPVAGDTVRVEVNGGCRWPWTATTEDRFITMISATGVGPGTLTFAVAPNTGPAREGRVTIPGQPITVLQAGR